MTWWYIVSRLLATVALAGQTACPESPGAPPSEYQVKAAFLYNFAKFVEWPQTAEDQNGPLAICVLGKDPFGGALERVIEGKTVNGRSITIRHLNEAGRAQACHILFISASEAGHFNEVLRSILERNVLTVSEIDGFCERGGVIAFVMDGRRVRFRINPKAAAGANLNISSKLLQLALPMPEDKDGH